MSGSRVTVGSQAASVSSISVYVGAVESPPHNEYSVAIYTDSSGSPAMLVARRANGTLLPNAWNTIGISATLNPNTAYWLMYNANGSDGFADDMFYNADPDYVGAWTAQAFGTWPNSFGGSTLDRTRYSLYATVSGSGTTLTPTPSPTPTTGTTMTLGLNAIASTLDTGDSNYMTGSQVMTGAQTLSVTSISVYVATADTPPNNQYSVAIYTDSGGAPATLVAHSANGTLLANAWNTIGINATLNSNTAYWLMYNANGSNGYVDDMPYDVDPDNVGAWTAQLFGTWPNGFGSATLQSTRYSIYATVQ
jgi:hypothetical protein